MKKLISFILFAFLFFLFGQHFIKFLKNNNSNLPNISLSAVTSAQAGEQTTKKQSTQTGKKQSMAQKICSSVTNILNNEIGKTKNKTKKGILQGGLKYTNEICGKGGTPDLTKVTEGLPEQDRLRISQKTNAVLFDGVDPNLKQENLTNVSKTLPTLTGKDGKITDLKSYDPSLKTVTVSANTAPPPLLIGAASNPTTNECKYTLPYKICEYRESEIKMIDKYFIKNTQNSLKIYKGQLAGEQEKCAKGRGCNKDLEKTLQKYIDEFEAAIKCYEEQKTAINNAAAECRICADGKTWSDAEGKCPEEKPKPPEPDKCPSPCYCGLYSNEPKCGLTDCEQLCVKEGYGCRKGTGQVPDAAGNCGCREGTGQVQDAKGNCGCPKNQELVNGDCRPICLGGQTRNAAGECECPKGKIFTIAKKCEDTKKKRSLTESEVKKLNDLADYFEKIGLEKDATLLRKLLKEGAINTDPNLKVFFRKAGGLTDGWTGKITIRTEFIQDIPETMVYLMAHELDHSRRISEAGFWQKLWYNTFGFLTFEKRGVEAGENALKLMNEYIQKGKK